MYTLFVILIVIVALFMIGIVLIQESKGGGLSTGFSSGNAMLGVRKTTDFIEKTTWGTRCSNGSAERLLRIRRSKGSYRGECHRESRYRAADNKP